MPHIKVLIVDDNISYRQFFVSAVEKLLNTDCLGTATTEQIAIRKCALLCPDLILLNMALPNSVQLLQEIKDTAVSVMVYDVDISHIKQQLTLKQLKVLSCFTKPSLIHDEIIATVNYLQPFIELLHTRKYALFKSKETVSKPITVYAAKYELCLIGISTGGPEALDYLVPRLNAELPCPIIIVQHMPPNFTEGLARKLNTDSRLTVSEVKGGEKLTAGHVYIAQGGKHLLLEKANDGFYLVIADTPPVNNCKPAVDVLFHSVAKVFTGRVLAIIMTGMGRDGTEGVRALKQQRCRCLVQDQASSVVWGMPRSVYEAGLADEVVPLQQLTQRINALVL